MPVVVLQGLLADDESQSVIRDLSAYREFGERSSLLKFFRREDRFEFGLLGHRDLSVAEGPLTVAALGWDPPERSTHFHVSLLSVEGDAVAEPTPPTAEELATLKKELSKLDSRSMTFLFGEGLDHGLVWERRVDLLTRTPEEVGEMGLRVSLPEGDQENDLRRFIDDSVNILAEQDFNLRRIDQGLRPINLCWPWGQGERIRVPNKVLELGHPWRVFAPTLSMRGIARLSGFRVSSLPMVSKLSDKGLDDLKRSLMDEAYSLAVLDFSGIEEPEELGYRANEVAQRLLLLLADWCVDHDRSMVVIATNQGGNGVVASVQKKVGERDIYPFDERSLSERNVGEIALDRILSSA
ncbi:MAG: hypothetical protein JST51_17625 [Armatimonadetes bacterium]|nr:hypothetical protein [Armatimonadota bacterium]